MTRSSRLLPVVDVASQRASDAAREVAEARARLTSQEERLVELINFRRQYDLASPTAQAARSFSFTNRRLFGGQLDEAIRVASLEIERARAQLEAKIEHWSQRHREVRAIEQLVERYATEERRGAERAEQRQADETNLRNFSRRGAED
ncbi:MAG TPA: flagellar export protein FliJ [Steroidobacteraceae bacterium]|nr:flagellar export protein FliJ [Steroidobacteraceae bacterium]